MYSTKNEALYRGRVHHEPYRIQGVQLASLRQNCVEAAGFSRPVGALHTVYARGVAVEVFPLELVEN